MLSPFVVGALLSLMSPPLPTPSPTPFLDCFFSVEAEAWIDTNGNGRRDEGERPLPGVQFQMFRSTAGVSDSQGVARLSGFVAGCYPIDTRLSAVAPRGYRLSTAGSLPLQGLGELGKRSFGFRSLSGTPPTSAASGPAPVAPSPATPGEPRGPDAKTLLAKGADLNARGQYDAAVSTLREAVKADPTDGYAWSYLAFALNALRRPADARPAATRATTLLPQDAAAWDSLAVSYLNEGRHAEAVAPLREVVRIQPESALAWYNLGAALSDSGEHAEAIDMFCRAVERAPQDERLWAGLHRAFAAAKGSVDARTVYTRLKRVHPARAEQFRQQFGG